VSKEIQLKQRALELATSIVLGTQHLKLELQAIERRKKEIEKDLASTWRRGDTRSDLSASRYRSYIDTNERCATESAPRSFVSRQHHVASDEVALRNEAPSADTLSRVAQFLNVGLGAVVYPVARAGIAAYDVEIPEALVARALLRREPFLQQGQCPRPRFEGTRPHHDQ
jgi:hypothetical protein